MFEAQAVINKVVCDNPSNFNLSAYSLHKHDRIEEILRCDPSATLDEIDQQITKEVSRIPDLKDALRKLIKVIKDKLTPD